MHRAPFHGAEPTKFPGQGARCAPYIWRFIADDRQQFPSYFEIKKAGTQKWVFVKSLRRDARDQLARPLLDSRFGTGAPKLMRSAEQMQALPDFFKAIPDPRHRRQNLGQRDRRRGRIFAPGKIRIPPSLAVAVKPTC